MSPLTVLAEDIVTLESAAGGRRQVTGEIVDWTGEQLELQAPGGRLIRLPGRDVVSVQSNYLPTHQEGDRLLAERDFSEAINQYTQALRAEDRAWVDRLLAAQLVRCNRELGDWQMAGDWFLELTRVDPLTPYFDVIPLAWRPVETTGEATRQALQWLDDPRPLARLLGASLLMSGTDRGRAITQLNSLTQEEDERISKLAVAQLWQKDVVTVEANTIDRWQRVAEQLPESLQAGPYYLIGRAWSQQGDHERAALALLRAPLLRPNDRHLAVPGLRQAAIELQRGGNDAEAILLYRRFLRDYADSDYAADVQNRLREIDDSFGE